MVASIIIWFLGYYPRHPEYTSIAEQQEHSYIGQIGKAIEPVLNLRIRLETGYWLVVRCWSEGIGRKYIGCLVCQ